MSDSSSRRHFGLYIFPVVAILAAVILYRLDPFEPKPLPNHDVFGQVLVAPRRNKHMLNGSEQIGVGLLAGPEDILYDSKIKVLYTGCDDGWIKQVTLNDSAMDTVVKNWAQVGGRPLGLAFGRRKSIIVADADKGLVSITKNGVPKLLTKQAGSIPFMLTDAVDVAKDGLIYFTDASFKYSLKDFIFDILEGNPNGRFMSYNRTTKRTKVLVKDLYFPNGVAVSPDQKHVFFCETIMRRCKKYHRKGKKKGTVDIFSNNLPGLPDNIHYDGHGHYLIALTTASTTPLKMALKYPFVRKIMAILVRYVGRPQLEKNGGVFVVDLKGNPVSHYDDTDLALISTARMVGDELYCGSLVNQYIIRLNVTQYPAQPIM